MKRVLSFLFALALSSSLFATYFVKVNDGPYYEAEPLDSKDSQGRSQFRASCVPLAAGDVMTFHNSTSGSAWVISTLDPYGEHTKFTADASGIHCVTAGTFDVYMKLSMGNDAIYIGPASGDCVPSPLATPSTYTGSVPWSSKDVMLQAFYWDSNYPSAEEYAAFGNTRWESLQSQAAEIGNWFDLVWFPPSSLSSGGLGYIPLQLCNQNSDLGSAQQLYTLIDTLHAHGARVVADVVVNHIGGRTGWCDFYEEDFGEFGRFEPNMSWICNTDEAFTGGHCDNSNAGGYDDGYDGEANYPSARDWDHNGSENVRNMFRAYARFLKSNVGYDGYRYDYCKGLHSSHLNDYNCAGEAYFSVMEYWDSNMGTIRARLQDANWNTLAFDFGTKYSAFNGAIASGNFGGCVNAGMRGAGIARHAVTFVDSHDTFHRNNDEFCGQGNSLTYGDKIMQAYAYLLCLPGIPCVFYPHYQAHKTAIQMMINARYKAGVHSESPVYDEQGDANHYQATIQGTNGYLRVLLGQKTLYGFAPTNDYEEVISGSNWGIYMYLPNGSVQDKNVSRTPRPATPRSYTPTAVEQLETTAPACRKMMVGGRFLIEREGNCYSILGNRQ